MGGPAQQTGVGQTGGGSQATTQGSSMSQQNLNGIVGHYQFCLSWTLQGVLMSFHLPMLSTEYSIFVTSYCISRCFTCLSIHLEELRLLYFSYIEISCVNGFYYLLPSDSGVPKASDTWAAVSEDASGTCRSHTTGISQSVV
jgi:hypothetical protein